MAVNLLQSREVSDLCIGKPAIRSLPSSATVVEALIALKRGGDAVVGVWDSPEKKGITGKVCMVDVLCFLCAEENISAPAAALDAPVSALLPKDPALVCRVEPHSSVLEALDAILDGAHTLVVPIQPRKKLTGGGDLCWLTPEDFVRFFLNSIAFLSPASSLSVSSLGVISRANLSVLHRDPALSALPLVRAALADHISVAVLSDDGRFAGEISPSTLALCDESVAAALSTLSAGDLIAFIDCGGAPPDSAVRAVKASLADAGLVGMLELLESDFSSPSSSTSSSSSCSSSDEESPPAPAMVKRVRSTGSYSARMGRRSEEAIVCHPGSSLVAVMVQALAHRVSYVWVVDDEYRLVGIVGFLDMLRVFREHLQQPFEGEA